MGASSQTFSPGDDAPPRSASATSADSASAGSRSADSASSAGASWASEAAPSEGSSRSAGSARSEGSSRSEGSARSAGLPPVGSAAAGVGGVSGESLVRMVQVVDELASTVLSAAVPDEELVGSVGVIRRLEAVLSAERYRRVAEVDERCAYRVVGAGSTETWLSESQRVARPDAVVEVGVARALLELPATAGMLARGEIDEARARVAASAWRDLARETTTLPPDDRPGAGAPAGAGSASGESGDPARGPADDPDGGAPRSAADDPAGGPASTPAGDAGGHAGDAARGPTGADAEDSGFQGDADQAHAPAGGIADDDLEARLAAHERAREQARAEFDQMIADQARQKDRQGVSREVRRWRNRQDPERGARRAQRVHQRRNLWISTRRADDGTTVFSGRLDDVGAAKLRAAVDALSRPAQDSDRDIKDKRTPGQRRADALVALAEQGLNSGRLPEVTRQRPHVLLVTSPEGLHGVEGAPAPYLDGVGDIASETARMLCCDASVAPVTIRNGEVLDAGPRQSVVSARQRDAVLARDRCCVGCGARAALSQIHHITWLSQGGRHDIDNLVLVCFDCHFHIHHHDWKVVRDEDRRYRLARPDKLTSAPGTSFGEEPRDQASPPSGWVKDRCDEAGARNDAQEGPAAGACRDGWRRASDGGGSADRACSGDRGGQGDRGEPGGRGDCAERGDSNGQGDAVCPHGSGGVDGSGDLGAFERAGPDDRAGPVRRGGAGGPEQAGGSRDSGEGGHAGGRADAGEGGHAGDRHGAPGRLEGRLFDEVPA